MSSIVDGMAKEGDIPDEVKIVIANTPSYVGSHVTGFANMTAAFVRTLATYDDSKPRNHVNIIPGFVDPADMREVKRLAKAFNVDACVFPDTSDVVDAPLTGSLQLYPDGGARLPGIERTGNALATFVLGPEAGGAAGRELEKRFEIPLTLGPVPMGIRGTDAFVGRLADTFGLEVPRELTKERGRVVDMMVDAHNHMHGKRVAIFGDPDVVCGLAGLAVELGMEPVFVVTGSPSSDFEVTARAAMGDAGSQAVVKAEIDFMQLHDWIKECPVDLLVGNTYGKFIAKAEDIPLVRAGFPILDRANLHHFPTLGYAGAARLVEVIGNTLLERADRDADEETLELIM